MKKFMALLAVTAMTVGVITGCGAAKGTNEAAAPAEKAEDAGQAEAENGSEEAAPAEERTTFTVGFDAEFPLTGIWMRTVSIQGLTLILRRRYAPAEGGNW